MQPKLNQHLPRFQSFVVLKPTISSSRYLIQVPYWPVLAISFFAMSSGSITLLGLPQTFVLSLTMSVLMLFKMRVQINRDGLRFTLCLLAGYLTGTINAISTGTLDVMSLINLSASLVMFVIVFGYTTTLLNRDTGQLQAILERVFLVFAALSIAEILYYEEFFTLRNIYYRGVLANHYYRDELLYGLSRPTGLFTEPSNFARFMGLMLAMHMIVAQSMLRSLAWFVIFIVLIRSPMIFNAVPVMLAAIYPLYIQPWLKKNPGNPGIVGTKLAIFALGALALVAVFVYFQQERIQNAQEGSDGSFTARLLLPLQYILERWNDPLLGSGPTPLDEINLYVNALYIDAGRDWLIDTDFRLGLASTLVVVIGMGVLGLIMFLVLALLFFGRRGWWLVIAFLAINLLSAGANAASMFVPSALALAMCWHMWDLKRRVRSR